MSSLVSLLEREGRERGLLGDGESLSAEGAFALVRDMPYRRASSRRPEAIVEEWQRDLLREALSACRYLSGAGAGIAGDNVHYTGSRRRIPGISRRSLADVGGRPVPFQMCIRICG